MCINGSLQASVPLIIDSVMTYVTRWVSDISINFAEHVVNIRNSLAVGTDFSSLPGFIWEINSMDFLELRRIAGSF